MSRTLNLDPTDPSRCLCPLCGHRFSADGIDCGTCPAHDACGVIHCPQCGYTFIERSTTMGLMERLACRLKGWLQGSKESS